MLVSPYTRRPAFPRPCVPWAGTLLPSNEAGKCGVKADVKATREDTTCGRRKVACYFKCDATGRRPLPTHFVWFLIGLNRRALELGRAIAVDQMDRHPGKLRQQFIRELLSA